MGRTHEIEAPRTTGRDCPDDIRFDRFFRDHYDQQVRRAYLMVGSSAAAHDIAAEAFGAVYQRWDGLEDPVRYLSRCVLNGCRDWGRRRTRWSKVVSAVDPLPEFEGTDPTPADGFPLVELADALARLPLRQRAAIVLRFYGRESEAAIADVLGCRPGTVGSLIHRGLSRLRQDLS